MSFKGAKGHLLNASSKSPVKTFDGSLGLLFQFIMVRLAMVLISAIWNFNGVWIEIL
jgi:hypothetical protein